MAKPSLLITRIVRTHNAAGLPTHPACWSRSSLLALSGLASFRLLLLCHCRVVLRRLASGSSLAVPPVGARRSPHRRVGPQRERQLQLASKPPTAPASHTLHSNTKRRHVRMGREATGGGDGRGGEHGVRRRHRHRSVCVRVCQCLWVPRGDSWPTKQPAGTSRSAAEQKRDHHARTHTPLIHVCLLSVLPAPLLSACCG